MSEITTEGWRVALRVAELELGRPYVWGGDDPVLGFDCSGLAIECLRAAGRLPNQGDWRAVDLARLFPVVPEFQPGALVFWNRGRPPMIGHVELVYAEIPGKVLTIGASGGGSGTKTREDAITQNAYVKVRPVTPGWVRIVDPFFDER